MLRVEFRLRQVLRSGPLTGLCLIVQCSGWSPEMQQKAWVLAHFVMRFLAENPSISFSTGNVREWGHTRAAPLFPLKG